MNKYERMAQISVAQNLYLDFTLPTIFLMAAKRGSAMNHGGFVTPTMHCFSSSRWRTNKMNMKPHYYTGSSAVPGKHNIEECMGNF